MDCRGTSTTDRPVKRYFLASSVTAQALQTTANALVDAARAAWLAVRMPYQPSEVLRIGKPVVDDWEGRVTAWPLNEELINYVDGGYGIPSDENKFAALNCSPTRRSPCQTRISTPR